MSSFCPKCGSALKDGAIFCVKCGYKLEKREKKVSESKGKSRKKNKTNEPSVQTLTVLVENTKTTYSQEEVDIKEPTTDVPPSIEPITEEKNNEEENPAELPITTEPAPIDEKQSPIDNTQNSGKKINTWVLAVVFAALILGAVVFAFSRSMMPRMNYNKAISLIEESRYTEAIDILEGLGDYQDSKELIAKYIEKTYLSKDQVDVLADKRFEEFLSDFNSRFTQNLHAYLPHFLASREIKNHEYEYYYLYFYGNDNDKTSLKGVARIVIRTETRGKYEINVDDYVDYAVKLKNVNEHEMNIRDYPNEQLGNKVGKLPIGNSVQIYAVYYEDHLRDQYIWYCISSDGYTKWVADGINKKNVYYTFDNGANTKEIIFIR